MGEGELLPKKISASPPKPFAIIIELSHVILSKNFSGTFMKTAKNGQCACMRRHFSPKPKFLDRTLAGWLLTLSCINNVCIHVAILVCIKLGFIYKGRRWGGGGGGGGSAGEASSPNY